MYLESGHDVELSLVCQTCKSSEKFSVPRFLANWLFRCNGTKQPVHTPQILVFGPSQLTGRQTTYRVIFSCNCHIFSLSMAPHLLKTTTTFNSHCFRTFSGCQVKVLRDNHSTLVPFQRRENTFLIERVNSMLF